ncbi:hypothetical protein [Oscillibacter sp. GMB15532]|uniref:hypothetical protein n=1 Tax=Oscillibacter sp. GMB15532 TaxID=3230022 RepID=UPI0034DEE7F9
MSKTVAGGKVGARVLTEEEVTAILPTYKRLKQQIEAMRPQTDQKSANEADDYINNIGVLGKRGTGKTSILKTLKGQLEEDNKASKKRGEKEKNIILPMIVPENMPDSINLMAAILGLFEKQVEAIEKDAECFEHSCWEIGGSNALRTQFNALIKKFCFIQNDFRKVLVEQYTTENEYVRNSSKVFNSDSEFLPALNAFINSFLERKDVASDALIFLVIDDIDLSTHRCTDVVKTLLSYLNHPQMVILISGDLDTFEEALTLDFLRKDGALQAKLLKEEFLQDEKEKTSQGTVGTPPQGTPDGSLLRHKQQLAYEYMKKILPPLYRHSVKQWDIFERSAYQISQPAAQDPDNKATHTEQKDAEASLTLAALLTETFRDYGCAPYFQYWKEREIAPRGIPQVFHLFDNTARGLNSVYETLMSEKESLQAYGKVLLQKDMAATPKQLEESAYQSVKLFLETVAASNRMLSVSRGLLFQQVIHFGDDFSSSSVRFDNLYHEVYAQNRRNFENPIARFQIFIFADFAQRLLSPQVSDWQENVDYRKMRSLAVYELLEYPIISGYIQTIQTKDSKGNNSKGNNSSANKLLSVLLNSEIVFTLHYIQSALDFTQEEYEALLTDTKEADAVLVELGEEAQARKAKQDPVREAIYLSAADALWSIKRQLAKIGGEKRKNDEAQNEDLLSLYPEAVQALVDYPQKFAGDRRFLLQKVFGSFLETASKKLGKDGGSETSAFYPIQMTVLVNTLAEEVQDLFTEHDQLKAPNMMQREKFSNTEMTERQWGILCNIEQNQLWDSEDCAPVTDCLKRQIKSLFQEVSSKAEVSFKGIDKLLENKFGMLWTDPSMSDLQYGLAFLIQNIAHKTECAETISLATLGAIMGTEEPVLVKDCRNNEASNTMTVNGYCKNVRLHYKKSEVFQLRNQCNALRLLPASELPKRIRRNADWIYFFILQFLATHKTEQIYKQSAQAAQLENMLSDMEIKKAEAEEQKFKTLLDQEAILKAFPNQRRSGADNA